MWFALLPHLASSDPVNGPGAAYYYNNTNVACFLRGMWSGGIGAIDPATWQFLNTGPPLTGSIMDLQIG